MDVFSHLQGEGPDLPLSCSHPHTFTHTDTHTDIHRDTLTHRPTQRYAYIQRHTDTFTHTDTQMHSGTHTDTLRHRYIHMHTDKLRHAQIHIDAFTHTHTQINLHKHTQIHILFKLLFIQLHGVFALLSTSHVYLGLLQPCSVKGDV